ncbi:sensor histidine kinase [Ramlibacter algicola]|uniref:histidine kinase n=1 Tax=Ramlibacter algicola TaxID=2795217 RepID=A0A934Q0K2_9BURK|nr:ATP-binding protein [Ramlibacter algicola]MBK0392596.1 hypothetical protein [Ramlibacter algicola]
MRPEQFGLPGLAAAAGATWTVEIESGRVLWSEQARLLHEVPAGYNPTVWEALEAIEPEDRAPLFAAALACVTGGRPLRQLVTLRTPRSGRKRVLLEGARSTGPHGGLTLAGTLSPVQCPIGEVPSSSDAQELLAQLREWELLGHGLSHDLRAPAAAVHGFALALMSAEDGLSDRGKHHVRRIAAAGKRVEGLLDCILQFAHLSSQPLRPQFVDLSRLAEKSLAALRETDSHRRVDVRIDPEMRAYGDASLLRLVVHNLLDNAWKFTSRQLEATIHFSLEQYDLRQVYCVRDNGCGFRADEASRLFVPFQRLHSREQFDGSGMGLALVRRAVERHGGMVWAHSVPGQGASFWFGLPSRIGQSGPP